ncbi:hypothetical protein RhiirA5_399882 [Rhizophagus irregularis]|uniref:ribonuclease H n=3 Tax=Rhizophagus irregularis TaxID=588596 RepID=A0A2N0PKQ7_9GLOM|nr:hypothetical protein RhiirA5_399882 [Rhizophagus irregularis]
MTNNNTRVIPKTRTEREKSYQIHNTSPKNIQNSNATYTQDTNIQSNNATYTKDANIRSPQQEQDVHNSNSNISDINTFNLVLMGHNINGIGPDDFKLNMLMDYCANKRADIVGIVETNKDRKYGKFWNKQNPEYISFWTNKDNKIKGSGVCIIINKKWEKHLGKINRISAYYIEARLLLKNCTLIIGVVYMPPSDTEMKNELTNHIKNEFINHSKKNRYYILIGDLNTYIDKSLDYSGPSKLGKKPSNIITWLDNTFFVDTFRKLNPKQRSFTWSNKITSTRIDYIWADPKLETRIMKSHIYQSADITDSDHNITFAKISFTDIIVTNNKGGRRAEKNTKRIVYDYENTTNEQWNEYENYLKSLLEKHKAFRYIETHGRSEDTLNKLWDIICKCIQQASLKHIPHKKVGGTKTNLNRNYKEIEDSSKERKDLLYMRSIMRKLYKNELKGAELLKASKGIKTFNERYGTNISELTEDTDWHTWKCETRNWLKIERFIEIGKNRDKVTANKGSVPIRILGVWFKADKGDKHTEGIVKKEISTVLGAIRRKHITHMQAIYIINTVLLPRLEYRLKTTIWEDKKYEEIYKPIMKVVKHKTRLPINCHNNILLHSAQGNLKNLWRNQTAAQITEFLVALNSQSKQADMLKMRLKKAQLTLNITSCILMTDPDVTVPNKMLNNHAYNVIRKAHDYLFKIHPLVESEEWNIPIIGPDVRNFVYQQASELQKKDKEFIIRKAAALSIHGALQLLNHDASNTITWQQICDINKRQARGRTPKWFTTLSGLIQQSTQLKDLCKTNIEPSNSERETEIDREALINMQAFKMTKKMPSKDSRKKEFVYTHQDGTLVWGQIIKKNNKTGKFTIQHWVRNSNNQSEDSGMMQKVIQRCSGCRLNDRRVNKESYNCHFNRDYSDLACINRIFSCQNNSDTKVIKDIIETRKCPGRQCISEQISDRIQIQDYDTALIRNTVSNEEARTQHITLLHQLRSIFNPSNTIDIYTDGSLTDRFNTNLNDFTKHMGTGWVIINDKNEVILECSSSITDWPSSTRAELGAILSAILVLQTGQRANIFTDSQAAIDSINHTRINLTNGKNKIRIWCKSNNYSIISSIINLIDSKHLEIKLIKVKGHSGVKGNEEADRVAKNDTGKSTCITINDSQQKDLKYDLYWDGKRVDRHIRKFIDNLCGSALEASWSFNRTHRTIFQDTTHMIEEKVTWAIFKKNTGFNCTTTTVNNNFIKHLKLTNNLLPTLEIMKERRYDLYGDVKCRLCLVENEDDDHIIYCQQLRDKWLIMANNTINKCEQMLKDFLSKKEYIQLNQEDIQQLHLWNRNFFVHTTGFNQELPIPFVHLMLRNLFPKGRYRELRSIVKSEKATLTIASLFLEMFITEFYKVIWQPRCDIVADWERTKGIKKQDLRKKISAQQRIVYERIPTQQVEDEISAKYIWLNEYSNNHYAYSNTRIYSSYSNNCYMIPNTNMLKT